MEKLLEANHITTETRYVTADSSHPSLDAAMLARAGWLLSALHVSDTPGGPPIPPPALMLVNSRQAFRDLFDLWDATRPQAPAPSREAPAGSLAAIVAGWDEEHSATLDDVSKVHWADEIDWRTAHEIARRLDEELAKDA